MRGANGSTRTRPAGGVADRPGLLQALDQLRDGDTFVIWKLDRRGRSVKQLVDFVSGFERDGVNFVSITDSTGALRPAGSSSM